MIKISFKTTRRRVTVTVLEHQAGEQRHDALERGRSPTAERGSSPNLASHIRARSPDVSLGRKANGIGPPGGCRLRRSSRSGPCDRSEGGSRSATGASYYGRTPATSERWTTKYSP